MDSNDIKRFLKSFPCLNSLHLLYRFSFSLEKMSFRDQVKHGMPENDFKHREIARNYNSMGNICEHGTELSDFIKSHSETKDAKILDFGCGTGLVGIPLLSASKQVVFLDPNSAMIEVLTESLDKQEHKNYIIHNGTIFDCKETGFDVAVCSLVLHHVDKHEEVLKEIFNHIVPGGKIFVAEFAPNPDRPAWSKDEFIGILAKAGFTEIQHQQWKTLRMPAKDSDGFKEQPLQLAYGIKPK